MKPFDVKLTWGTQNWMFPKFVFIALAEEVFAQRVTGILKKIKNKKIKKTKNFKND